MSEIIHKRPGRPSVGVCIALALLLGACGSRDSSRKLDPSLARLVAEKKAQAKEMATGETNPVPKEVWKFFDLVAGDNWRAATNAFERIRPKNYYSQPPKSGFWAAVDAIFGDGRESTTATAMNDAMWCPVHETLGAAECFHDWDIQLLHRFGRDIIGSIPAGSIYFGGTDPGRFVITAMSDSHREGKPFYTITQNALADGRYLNYLQQMYGKKIYIPTSADSQAAFNEYLADAQERLQSGKLKPGEDVKTVNNRVQVTGQVAVMAINGLLVKVIFDKNPEHEFYIEESFPLDWMYPYLSPHGLIMKINRERLGELGEAITQEDHKYWRRYVGKLLGEWLNETTSVSEVCDFADKVYLRKDMQGFTGDLAFARNDAAQKAFSKLRSAIAGVYVWRLGQAETDEEKARMQREADYAFRQAFALCPYSPEAVFRYVNFLISEKRQGDALLIAHAAQRVDPSNVQIAQLAKQLELR